MKIILLGAGVVGATLAEQLAKENHDVAIVDHNADLLHDIHRRMDVKIVAGHASYPEVMREAGAEDADMVIAVTNNDEVNMVACQVAHSLFEVPLKIARIRTPNYFTRRDLYSDAHLPIDVFINPEVLLTRHIRQVIEVPGASQVLDFFKAKAKLVLVKLMEHATWVGQDATACLADEPHACFVAVHREGRTLCANTVLRPGDEVFFMVAAKQLPKVMQRLSTDGSGCKRIMIAGGGNIGRRLADRLSSDYMVKIIDQDAGRCKHLADALKSVVVLNGDASDRELLVEEGIENMDVFCAVTHQDEANIMSCLQAKKLGAKRVIALVNRETYVELMLDSPIDVVLNPQGVTVSGVLTHLRQGDFAHVYACPGGAEAIEAVVRGDAKRSKLAGRTIEDLQLPDGVRVMACMRNKQLIMDLTKETLVHGDRLAFLVTDLPSLNYVQKLFHIQPD